MTVIILLLIIATNAVHYFDHRGWTKKDIFLLLIQCIAVTAFWEETNVSL